MVAEIATWFNDLNLDGLRVSRPSKVLFLCGGSIEKVAKARASNLRDYLHRVRPMRTKHQIVLAEEANQLYRDTNYRDLITFEEDIARISAVVLVIAESAGSLAELGAFASSDVIRQALRVVIPTRYEIAESFVRYGPIERLKNDSREYIGVYPWEEHKNGKLNIRSTKSHYREIVSFINGHLKKVPSSTMYRKLERTKEFYIIYWIIYLSTAISPKVLYNTIKDIIPNMTDSEIRDKIYCLIIAKWIAKESYSDKDYFYSLIDVDPFVYSYRPGVKETSAIRRKIEVHAGLKAAERIPTHVAKLAVKSRGLR